MMFNPYLKKAVDDIWDRRINDNKFEKKHIRQLYEHLLNIYKDISEQQEEIEYIKEYLGVEYKENKGLVKIKNKL